MVQARIPRRLAYVSPESLANSEIPYKSRGSISDGIPEGTIKAFSDTGMDVSSELKRICERVGCSLEWALEYSDRTKWTVIRKFTKLAVHATASKSSRVEFIRPRIDLGGMEPGTYRIKVRIRGGNFEDDQDLPELIHIVAVEAGVCTRLELVERETLPVLRAGAKTRLHRDFLQLVPYDSKGNKAALPHGSLGVKVQTQAKEPVPAEIEIVGEEIRIVSLTLPGMKAKGVSLTIKARVSDRDSGGKSRAIVTEPVKFIVAPGTVSAHPRALHPPALHPPSNS